MPPAILNDSEDEGDDVVFDDDNHGSLSRSSGEEPAGIPGLDGTREDDQSTGSTERLKRQLYDAHRNLCVDSGEQARSSLGNSTAQASPSVQITKRRHTAVFSGAAAEYSPEKVKRTKTLKTYSSKKSSPAAKAEAARQDLPNPRTSQSAKFSEHSGMQQSSDLPLGSIQAGFVNHEPAVMFRDTGSTVPDNESSHERMIEEAIRSKGAKSTPMVKLVNSDEMQKSSSFPWSASEQTETAKSPQRNNNVALAAGLTPVQAATSNYRLDESGAGGKDADKEFIVATENEDHDPPEVSNHSLAAIDRPKSSPVVRINVSELPTSDAKRDVITSTEKASRGRKRKTQQESSEPLNSEDIAVGLPLERYQPRPSRRRTTQALEEPIDYSIVPEKAAKKRRKTASASFEAHAEPKAGADTPVPDPVARTHKLQPVKKPASADVDIETAAAVVPPTESKVDPEVEAAVPHANSAAKTPNLKDTGTAETKPVQQLSQRSSQLRSDDGIFLKPATKSKSVSKSMRSHTTIFEDHVAFTGNERSPSLSQQQAKHKSALRDVKTEQSPVKSRRGAKHVLSSDDEDDEAEIALHEEAEEEDEPPKKRGRGRPPKAAAKAVVKPLETTVSAGDAPKDESGMVTPGAPPKKRGRGRPPKAAAPPPEDPEDEDTAKENTKASKPIATEAGPDTPAKPSIAAEMPTPSPDQTSTTKEIATPQKPVKTGPTAHSPIKNSSIVPHRVGLSKRSRIPSLLKVMRPPPKR